LPPTFNSIISSSGCTTLIFSCSYIHSCFSLCNSYFSTYILLRASIAWSIISYLLFLSTSNFLDKVSLYVTISLMISSNFSSKWLLLRFIINRYLL
jgi:hypothetical protein